ncbi:hypothetical protein [Algibacter lectus]|uniref:hypothetical protein n=1 Tax=Algibacter lectus TaxID=221126 RepID=UPI0005A63F36|nr:hypothetical protein [Algibacter lectus]
MIHIVKTSVGVMQVYENYVIGIVNEGETVTDLSNADLFKIAKTHFKNKKFVYISHRINSYAVDPVIYIQASKIENLVGFAIVSSKKIARINSQIEQIFSKKPLKTFTEINDATEWANNAVREADDK